jgi:hypothetical protein
MWHKILYRGRKSIFGRVLISCWAILFLSVTLLFLFPTSHWVPGPPIISPFAFLLVLTTVICGISQILRALLKRG